MPVVQIVSNSSKSSRPITWPTAYSDGNPGNVEWSKLIPKEPRRNCNSGHFFGYSSDGHWYYSCSLDDAEPCEFQ